jgi:hypothetical protein
MLILRATEGRIPFVGGTFLDFLCADISISVAGITIGIF